MLCKEKEQELGKTDDRDNDTHSQGHEKRAIDMIPKLLEFPFREQLKRRHIERLQRIDQGFKDPGDEGDGAS